MGLRYLSINQLADLTGKDRRTLSKRLAEASLTPIKEGRGHYYDAREVLPLLYGSTPEGSSESLAKQQAQAELKLTQAKAEKAALEVALAQGEVVSIEEVARTVEREYTFVSSQLKALPTRVAQPVSLMVGRPADIRDYLQRTIDDALKELKAVGHYEQRRADLESVTEETVRGENEDPQTGSGSQPS